MMQKVKRVGLVIKSIGIVNFIKTSSLFFKNQIYNKIKYPCIGNFKEIKKYFENKKGLEIGGPSPIFKSNGFIPIYIYIKSIDGVNFKTKDNRFYKYINDKFIIDDNEVGKIYIADVTDLSILSNNSYDFILSSNNLEHIANPMKGIEQCLLKLRDRGILVIVVPRKESCFDHKRNVVKFEHILNDYFQNIGEDDLSHAEEILSSHDLNRDITMSIQNEEFSKIVYNNFENRSLHHHVFDLDVLEKMCNYFNMKIIKKDFRETDHVIIAEKQ
jgi:SAM-dependent methyltransferase